MEELGIECGYRVLNLRFVGFELGRVGNFFLGKTMLCTNTRVFEK